MSKKALASLAAAALLVPAAAQAQLIGGGLPSLPQVGAPPALPSGSPLPDVRGAVRDLPDRARTTLRELSDRVGETTAQATARLLREHSRFLEADPAGAAVVRGEVVAMAPSEAALNRARQMGFRIARTEVLGELGLSAVVLTPPRRMSAVEAVRTLRSLDPSGAYEFNHVYFESGAATSASAAPARASGASSAVRVGIVDGTVAAHPTLAGVPVVQQAFAPGGARVSAHATAIASLIAGRQGPFRGAAPGARLYVADVYGPTPAGGSATAIARGLSWLAQNRVAVIDISLVGPDNALLAAAVRAMSARGHLIVAAVGNDGPAAAPLYPAAYPETIAVTAVDAQGRALNEAGRGPHVDFAAPGAQMAAAAPGRGFVPVRGTSFAAPLAAGELARLMPTPDPAAAKAAVAKLSAQAVDAGAAGADPVYGRGIVAAELRIDPAAVGARGLALRGR